PSPRGHAGDPPPAARSSPRARPSRRAPRRPRARRPRCRARARARRRGLPPWRATLPRARASLQTGWAVLHRTHGRTGSGARADVALLLLAAPEAPLRRLGQRARAAPPPPARRARPLPELGLGGGRPAPRLPPRRPRSPRTRRLRLGGGQHLLDDRLRARPGRALEDARPLPDPHHRPLARRAGRSPVRRQLPRPRRPSGGDRGPRPPGGLDEAAVGGGAHAAVAAGDAGARAAAPEAIRHARGGDHPHARGQPAPDRRAGAASHGERRHPARGRHLRVEVRQLRTRRLALPVQRRRGARDLEPRHLPGAARARQRVVGARPGGGGARRRLPPAAHHDRRAGGTLGPPRPARRLPARGARVPPDAVSRRLRPALVLGILVAGCGVSPDTTQVELRAYLARTRSWAPVEAEANRTIKRILATQFVDEAEIRRQIADSRPRILTHLEHLRGYAPRSKDIARIHARYLAAWETLL